MRPQRQNARVLLAVALVLGEVFAGRPMGVVGQVVDRADSARFAQGLIPVAVAVVENIHSYGDAEAVVLRLPGGRPPLDKILMRQGVVNESTVARALFTLSAVYEREGVCPKRREVLKVVEEDVRPVWWDGVMETRVLPGLMDSLESTEASPLEGVGTVVWRELWIPRLVPSSLPFDPTQWWKGVCVEGGLVDASKR